jgi:transposase-like protein
LPTGAVGEPFAAATKWHLDKVVITITGTKHWLWRAVDQEGFVLDVLVQIRRVFTATPYQDTVAKFHSARSQAFSAWAEITGVAMAA